MSTTWKQQKEAFVSDHNGGSLIELIAVAAVVPLCCGARLKLHDAKDSTTVKLAKDAILLVAPIAASLTIGADYMPAAFLVLAAVAFRTQKQQVRLLSQKNGQVDYTHVIRLFRACQAVFTGICILAVDFRAFPRRFCKTETYGYSLMDMGVGSFVVGNAMISRLVLGRTWQPKRILPLVVLGLGRLITVKASGYPEHVTEYGVHWNAFFTLAVVDLCDGLGCYLKLGPGGCLCAAMALMVVPRFGLGAAYVLSDAPRDSLFAANREGLASAPGRGVVFCGGGVLRFRPRPRPKTPISRRLRSISLQPLPEQTWSSRPRLRVGRVPGARVARGPAVAARRRRAVRAAVSGLQRLDPDALRAFREETARSGPGRRRRAPAVLVPRGERDDRRVQFRDRLAEDAGMVGRGRARREDFRGRVLGADRDGGDEA